MYLLKIKTLFAKKTSTKELGGYGDETYLILPTTSTT